MFLKIQKNKENIIKINKIDKTEIKKNQKVYTFDNMIKEYFNIIFCLNDKINSFKDKKNGYIYTNSDNGNIWNINNYNKETDKIEVLGTFEKDKIEVFFEEFKNYGFTNKLSDLYIKDILNNFKLFLKKIYGNNFKEDFIINFCINRNAIYNNKNDDIFIIECKNENKAKKLLKLSENKVDLKKEMVKKEIGNSKKLALFMRKNYLKEVFNTDMPSLKKTRSFFCGKILIDGIYIYRFSYDFFNNILEEYNLKK